MNLFQLFDSAFSNWFKARARTRQPKVSRSSFRHYRHHAAQTNYIPSPRRGWHYENGNLVRNVAIGLLLTLLCGCNLTLVKKASAFTLADAQAALVIAQQAGDNYGITCWSEVINWVQTVPQVSQPVVGALSAIEGGRVDLLFVNAGVPANVRRDCAAIGIAL
jgi:hypothetical protein